MIDMQKIMPIWKVENGTMVSMQGDVTIAFRLELPENGSLSAEQFEGLHQSFVKAARVMTPGSVIHKADLFFKDMVKANFEQFAGVEGEAVLARASERHFNERPYLAH